MDHQKLIDDCLADPTGQQIAAEFGAHVDSLKAQPGFAAGPSALDWTAVISKLLPLLPSLLTLLTNFSPAGIATLIPTVISILFPGLDSTLVGLIQKFIEYLLTKVPQAA